MPARVLPRIRTRPPALMGATERPSSASSSRIGKDAILDLLAQVRARKAARLQVRVPPLVLLEVLRLVLAVAPMPFKGERLVNVVVARACWRSEFVAGFQKELTMPPRWQRDRRPRLHWAEEAPLALVQQAVLAALVQQAVLAASGQQAVLAASEQQAVLAASGQQAVLAASGQRVAPACAQRPSLPWGSLGAAPSLP